MSTFLFVVFPYIALAVFAVGMVLRFRYDQLGWTTRSSQFYEARMLRVGGPLFHVGLFMALGGHFMGLAIPKSATDALGIDQHTYHLIAVGGGFTAGVMVLLGFTILLLRRATVRAVWLATTRMDKVMYVLLAIIVALGTWNTLSTALTDVYNYREGVSPWFRGIFTLNPQAELITTAPIQFQLHALAAFALLAIWPFTRLVHVVSVPLKYVTRPFIVYRSTRAAWATEKSRAPQGTWVSPSSRLRR